MLLLLICNPYVGGAEESTNSVAETVLGAVDPRYPFELRRAPVDNWSRLPWVRIQQLESEREQLLDQIALLPQHDPKSRIGFLGYHSVFEESNPGESLQETRFLIDLRNGRPIGSIAFAPVFNSTASGAYAFPKRFKIEVRSSDDFETVVDWLEEDFPDPGPYPVFFGEINRMAKQIRITVPQVKGESGKDCFALDEIYLFREEPEGLIGDNMIDWVETTIEVSDSLSIPLVWDTQYLSDGVSGFGLPLSDELSAPADFLVGYEEEAALSDKVQITLDLGRPRKVGPVDLWPAALLYQLNQPSFGFPERVTVELSRKPDFKPVEKFGMESAGKRMPRSDLLSIKCQGGIGRYLRITMEGLSTYRGRKILGIGEISVSNNKVVWSTGCKVTAQGIPEEYIDQLPRLVDGCCRQRRILPQGEWIRGLAMRRPLDRRLAQVEQHLDQSRAAWERVKKRSIIWGAIIIILSLIAGLILQRLQRRRILKKLKHRIARDLHDEVGSNLGSISFTVEHLKQAVEDPEILPEILDLSLISREACASLREVVWVTDESVIRLPALLQKLVERAERVLQGMTLAVEVAPDCPDIIVSLTCKRHLIMFFKEVIHNCARHSKATKVALKFSTGDKRLHLSVRDNGCGFDPASASDGWGLGSMKERTGEIGGELTIQSAPGKGTYIEFCAPLSILSKDLGDAYTTSN